LSERVTSEASEWKSRLARSRVARLATMYTAAAFHNRRVSHLFEGEGEPRDHADWADAWDRAAALLNETPSDAALPALADYLEREAPQATPLAWRAVCRHAAAEIRWIQRQVG
jgi:hypothetical protein